MERRRLLDDLRSDSIRQRVVKIPEDGETVLEAAAIESVTARRRFVMLSSCQGILKPQVTNVSSQLSQGDHPVRNWEALDIALDPSCA